MQQTFSEDEYLLAYPEGIDAHFWNRTRNDRLKSALSAVAPEDGLILDVGCGMGVATRYLRQHGYDCHGVELGQAPLPPDLADYVQTGTDVADLDSSFRERVKVLLLLDVLEHLDDRVAFLQRLAQLFPQAGKLVVTVPARMEIWSNYDDFWHHRLRYNCEGLGAELEAAGYHVQSVGYFFHLVYLVARLMSALGMQRSTGFEAPSRNLLTRTLHGLLSCYGWIENRVLPGKLPGSSILAIAQR